MNPRRLTGAFALTLAALVATALPASAQQRGISDPAGDAGGGLDITRAVVNNGDSAVKARIHFVALTRGDVVVSIDRREGSGLRLISVRKSDGSTPSFVARGAFTDRNVGGKVACHGFRVRWNEDRATVTMRMPSRCLHRGNFGAIRFAVLTERRAGDTDWAPQSRSGDLRSSAWVARG